MNLPPELTARIEQILADVFPESAERAARCRKATVSVAEPLHKEMEELKAQLADTEASRQEYIRLFHEQERENDALEAQLAEAKNRQELIDAAQGVLEVFIPWAEREYGEDWRDEEEPLAALEAVVIKLKRRMR